MYTLISQTKQGPLTKQHYLRTKDSNNGILPTQGTREMLRSSNFYIIKCFRINDTQSIKFELLSFPQKAKRIAIK